MIMVYFVDADTRPDDGGYVWYHLTTDHDLLQHALNDIRKAYPSVSNLDYLFIATWDHVGYFKMKTDKVCVAIKKLNSV